MGMSAYVMYADVDPFEWLIGVDGGMGILRMSVLALVGIMKFDSLSSCCHLLVVVGGCAHALPAHPLVAFLRRLSLSYSFVLHLLLVYLLIHSNTILIHIRPSSQPFFLSPPTHSCATPFLCPIQIPHPPRPSLVEEDLRKGVHLPTLSTFAPWCSRHLVVCFCAPTTS